MTQVRKVEGTVEAVADHSDKNHYGIKIDDEWFNGEDSTEIEKGDKVKMAVQDGEDFIDIKNLKAIQGGENDNSRSEQVRSKTGGGGSQSPSHLTKNQQIDLKVAHKSAVRQLDRRSAETDDDYREMLTKLTKLHLESLEEVEEWMQE